MSNKFQKSVFERLEQESNRNKKEKKLPVEMQEPAVQATNLPVASVKDEKYVEQQTRQLPTDIGGFLRPTQNRLAKNKTFYLDGDVIDMIKNAARAQGVTDSKLVNDILRKVLGIDA